MVKQKMKRMEQETTLIPLIMLHDQQDRCGFLLAGGCINLSLHLPTELLLLSETHSASCSVCMWWRECI